MVRVLFVQADVESSALCESVDASGDVVLDSLSVMSTEYLQV